MTTFYVAKNGSDGNPGTSGSPFLTINLAISRCAATGDTIIVRNGLYQNGTTWVDKSVVLRSENKYGAQLRTIDNSSQFNCVSISANNVTIDGFDISSYLGDGITAGSRSGNIKYGIYGLTFINNRCNDCGESGIQFDYCDLIRCEGNECLRNSRTGWFSGISCYEPQNLSTTGARVEGDYRIVIRGNVCSDNYTAASSPLFMQTDANGIICDDFRNSYDGGPLYNGKALVERNLCVNNGGKGIQILLSDNVIVRQNTCVENSQNPNTVPGTAGDVGWRAEINNSSGANNTFTNNVAVARKGSVGQLATNSALGNQTISDRGPNTNTTFDHNIAYQIVAGGLLVDTYSGGTAGLQVPSSGAPYFNLLGVNPLLTSSYRLGPGSPAKGAGAGGVDMGAFTGATLAAGPAVCSAAGKPANLRVGRKMVAGAAVYSVAAQPAILAKNALNRLAASPNIMALASQPAKLRFSRRIAAAAGECAATAQPASFSVAAAPPPVDVPVAGPTNSMLILIFVNM